MRLTKFDSGDLRDRVRFIGRLQRPGEQRTFGNRLRRQLRLDAGTTEKKKLTYAALGGRANDVVLDAQILEKKLNRIIIVCLYPADLCRRENHDVRPCLRKEPGNRRFVTEIEARSIAR